MIWLGIQWGAAVFGVLFGAFFIFGGARRVVRAHEEPRPAEAHVWGGVGVLVGVGLFAWVVWLSASHLLS